MARTLIALIFVLAFFAGLGFLGWYLVEEKIRDKPEYRLNADNITVSPPPIWVSEQFVEEVLRTSGLNQTGSLLDSTLPHQLAEAFVAHPWVERVEQVEPRYPSGAVVRLIYRTPVALVEIPGRGIFPVDRHGVVLPSEYLTETISDRMSEHLLIQGIQTLPLGSVGMPWGNPLVPLGAQLAEALADIAEPLNLARIVSTTEATPSGTRAVWHVRTTAGTAFHWGTFVRDDPNTETKKRRLRNLREQFRSLDNVPEYFRDLSRE